MIKTVLKTIAAATLVLSANSALATSVTQAAPFAVNSFGGVTFDIGADGTDGAGSGTFEGYISDFDYTFTVPEELNIVRLTDLFAPSDAGFTVTTDGLAALTTNNGPSGQNTPGQVLAFATPGESTLRVQGVVTDFLGIDIFEILFDTSTAGLFNVSYSGGYTPLLAAGAPGTFVTDSGSFDVRVGPVPDVIPLPAGGLLLITGAGALMALRRRKHAA